MGLIALPEADPQYWVILETIRSVRMCHTEESVAALLDTAVNEPDLLPKGGPTHAVVNRFQWLGWVIKPGAVVSDRWGDFSLFDASFNEIRLRAQKSWQMVIGSKVADRPLFQGVGTVDCVSTRSFLNLLTPQDQALYRKALNGASFTNDVCCYFSETGSTACIFCGEPDSRVHRFWKCKVFIQERKACATEIDSWLQKFPPSVMEAGWFPQSPTLDQWWCMLQSLGAPDCRDIELCGIHCDQWVDLFTDGSCMFPAQPAYRFASWAVCIAGLDVSWTYSDVLGAGPLPGILQSAFRAEMYALLQALRWAIRTRRKIRVWCDCLGVVERAQRLASSTWKVSVNSANADLWKRIEEAIGQLGAVNFCITKVAAHQDINRATSSLQSWVCLHNLLVDRAARLANLCRPSCFWELFHLHREQVEYYHACGSQIARIILDVSRKAVRREAMQQLEHTDGDGGVGEIDRIAPAIVSWTFAEPRDRVPAEVASRYGYRLAAMVKAWLDEGLSMGHAENNSSLWLSWHQLYLDFQLRTGEMGPIYERAWLDPVVRPSLRLRAFRFRKRSAWFAQLVKQLMRYEPYEVTHARCRPHSVAFALHTGCICIQWQAQRLQDVEFWVSARLSMAATRSGSSLDALPNAKQLEKWPKLKICAGPLGI